MTNEIMKKRATWSVAFDKSNHKAVALLSNIVPPKLDLTFVFLQNFKLEYLEGFYRTLVDLGSGCVYVTICCADLVQVALAILGIVTL